MQNPQGQTQTLLVKVLNHKAATYNLQTQEFSHLSLPTQVHAHTQLVMTAQDQIVVLGGEHRGQYTGTCQLFQLTTKDFIEGSKMPTPRINFGAIYHAGRVYVVGGWHSTFT